MGNGKLDLRIGAALRLKVKMSRHILLMLSFVLLALSVEENPIQAQSLFAQEQKAPAIEIVQKNTTPNTAPQIVQQNTAPNATSNTTPKTRANKQNLLALGQNFNSPTPLSPAFNMRRQSPINIIETLLEREVEETRYSAYKTLPIAEKVDQLIAVRKSGSLGSLKANAENILDTGILQLYQTNMPDAIKEFQHLYRVFEQGQYLFYVALASSVLDANRGKIEFNRYIRFARVQGESKIWYNLAQLILNVIEANAIHNKTEYRAIMKWFYDQSAYYTCYPMLKLYEKYIPPKKRTPGDWDFIHSLNTTLLIQSGNPSDAIAYLENANQLKSNLSPKLLSQLAILYYKTDQPMQAKDAFTHAEETATAENTTTSALNAAHYYYRALFYLREKNTTEFARTFATLKNLPANPSRDRFLATLNQMQTFIAVIDEYADKDFSF